MTRPTPTELVLRGATFVTLIGFGVFMLWEKVHEESVGTPMIVAGVFGAIGLTLYLLAVFGVPNTSPRLALVGQGVFGMGFTIGMVLMAIQWSSPLPALFALIVGCTAAYQLWLAATGRDPRSSSRSR